MMAAAQRKEEKSFDLEAIRRQFPVLDETRHGKRLSFLDSAASSQKPRCVIDAIQNYYEHHHANVHRGTYALSQESTEMYEAARRKLQAFMGAKEWESIVFTRGSTEAINLVAATLPYYLGLKPGDEILITTLEHHSNIVPWQILRDRFGITLKVADIFDDGRLNLESFKSQLSPKTKLAAFTHVSNTLGVINPVAEMIDAAKSVGALTLIDGSQAAPHFPIDVSALDCDFYALTGHKIYGPTGIGALYAKREHLEAMPPYHGGGDMILSVSFEKTVYNRAPYRFEAGTPNIAGGVGLAAALDFLSNIDLDAALEHERLLLQKLVAGLEGVGGTTLFAPHGAKVGLQSFVIDGLHPQDVGMIFDRSGVCVRTGSHCTEPLLNRLGVSATIRASMALYSNEEDIQQLLEAVVLAKSMLL